MRVVVLVVFHLVAGTPPRRRPRRLVGWAGVMVVSGCPWEGSRPLVLTFQ